MIHNTAIIEEGAKIGQNVHVGPFSWVGPDVEIGDDVSIDSHVVLKGHTKIGKGTRIFPHACLGCDPQSLKYKGEPSRLIIGENNTIREHVTMHPGTEDDNMETIIGNNGLFMAGSHVAHDCVVGDSVIFANNATLGGHVKVGDFAYLGGMSAIHPFVRIGHNAIVGGMSGVENDVIPYGSVFGDRASLEGLNIIGMRRRGYSREAIHGLRKAYRLLFAQEGTLAERLGDVEEVFDDNNVISQIVEFMKVKSRRDLCLPRLSHGS